MTVKKETTKKRDYSFVYVLLFFALMYGVYFLFNNMVDFYMIRHALNQANLEGYTYSQYITHPYSVLMVFNIALIVIPYIAYFEFIIMRSYIYSNPLKSILLRVLLAGIPFFILIPVNYQSADKLMASQLNSLYNVVNNDPTFSNTEIAGELKKSLIAKDYVTLKDLSNNLKEFAKLTPEQLGTVEEIANVMPVEEIKENFKIFKAGFKSYANYEKFYNTALTLFNQSTYKDNTELMLLMKKLEVKDYDYKSLRIQVNR